VSPNVAEPWRLPADEVAHRLATDPLVGLTADAARERLLAAGPNSLAERRADPWWRVLARQVTSPMILVLIVASGVVAAIGDLKDTVVILAIVVLNAILGFTQEYRAERAMAALRRMTSPSATVVRDGAPVGIPAADVVPGDVVVLAAGDLVTADLRLFEIHALRVNEASLTGESEPVEKVTEPLPDVSAALIADQRNLAFSGTAVTHGRATGIVIATGMATALGQVAELISTGPGATPLQRRLGRLGGELAAVALAVCALVFVTGIVRGEPVETMFLTAVSLAVAAIPEGLPAVITVALALGARRMAGRHALVRRLAAVETLGSVSVVCTDKTGTLTENRMQVERVWTPTGTIRVHGVGYDPAATFEPDPDDPAALDALAAAGALCNDASLVAPPAADVAWTITGDPTEGALVALAARRGLDVGALRERHPRLDEIGFDAGRRRMTTIHADGGCRLVVVKGAPEAVLRRLADDDGARAAAHAAAEAMAADGFRVLAIAERREDPGSAANGDPESGLRLLGLVGIADPPRAAARDAIAACRAAGILPVMVTGDHPSTAAAIAGRLGLLDNGRTLLSGAELEVMSDSRLDADVDRIGVYARTNPEQKVRIVRAWQARGAVVAMTGDGVNDAPALRLADIGVAMGITGTEVSKEAADMVLADDDFATIVAAVREGRRIYDNIRRFLRYLLTTNSAEIWVMAAAPFLGLPLPLLAIQILWINLVTDGLPALALGVEPAHENAMARPPRRSDESILGAGLWSQAIRIGLLMAAVTLGLQAGAIAAGWAWQTMVFTTLALLQLGNALAVRSTTLGLWQLGLGSNAALLVAVGLGAVLQFALIYVEPLRGLFETDPLGPAELIVVLVASTAGFLGVEVEKWWLRRRSGIG
jgi:Ca2+-transporting ATPase